MESLIATMEMWKLSARDRWVKERTITTASITFETIRRNATPSSFRAFTSRFFILFFIFSLQSLRYGGVVCLFPPILLPLWVAAQQEKQGKKTEGLQTVSRKRLYIGVARPCFHRSFRIYLLSLLRLLTLCKRWWGISDRYFAKRDDEGDGELAALERDPVAVCFTAKYLNLLCIYCKFPPLKKFSPFHYWF